MGRPSKYPVEFQNEAVRLVLDGGKSVSAAAQSVGVKTETLRKWVNREKIERGLKVGITRAEVEELKALKKENAKLKQHVEILEKATAFFASRGLDARK
jgi:transposase